VLDLKLSLCRCVIYISSFNFVYFALCCYSSTFINEKLNLTELLLFASCFIWVRSLTSHNEGETQAEGVRDCSAGENILV
jgi:hypothetical protein